MDQLNLLACSQLKLAQEGIDSFTNLVDFDDEDVSAIVRIFERPPHAPYTTGNLVNVSPFDFLEKSQKRSMIAIAIAKYYEETNCEVTLAGSQELCNADRGSERDCQPSR